MKTVLTLTVMLGLVMLGGCNKTDSGKAASSPRVITSPSNVSLSTPGAATASSDKIKLHYFDFENGYGGGAGFDSVGNRILAGGQNIWPGGETVKDDILLAKLNPAGDELWMVRWGTENFEQARELIADSNGDIYLAGHTNDPTDDNSDFLLLKYTGSGELLWEKAWGTTNVETVQVLTMDENHNVYAAGMSYVWGRKSPTGSQVLKVDSNGKELAGVNVNLDSICKIGGMVAAEDNAYVIATFELDNNKKKRALIFSLDKDFALDWEFTLKTEVGMSPRCIFETISGGLIVVGNAYRGDPAETVNLFRIAVSKQGELLSATEYQTDSKNLINDTLQAADGTVFCYFRGSPFQVVSFAASDTDPIAYTLDGGGSSVATISIAENPSGGIELYKDDPFEPGGQWTETTLAGTPLKCEVAEVAVLVEAVDIQTYAPDSTTTKLK